MPIRVPSVGQSATEVRLVEWCVAAGEPVKMGQVVAVVETDKSTVDVEAPADGVLGQHLAAADDMLDLGAELASVIVAGAPSPSSNRISPRARRRAAELGVNVNGLRGSGPDGLVVEADVPAAPTASADTWQGRRVVERRRLDPVQLVGARRTAESWRAAPHIVQMIDADLTAADEARRRAGATWTELGMVALARALAEHPHLNAAVDGDDLVRFAEVNVGVAVDTPRGLVVPVVRAADRRSLDEVSAAVRDLAARAREGRLAADEMEGGTATLSNLGAFGIRAGTPVLNPPESVLLFMGAVEDRPAVIDGLLTIRRMVTLSIAFDHRATDGAAAARFTATVRDLLSNSST